MPDSFSLISLGEFGDRARPLREGLREASLVIGLGQVGLHAVARVHEMLGALLTRREMGSNVRLLAIARRRSIRDESVLPRQERLTLNMDPIAWGDVPGRYAQLGVAQWWPHSPHIREALDDPNQVRAYNRLMLFDNAALIGEALYKLVQWLHEVGTGRDIKLMRRIYVLASLAEAEGSALIFDIVSRLRALSPQATIMGVFSLRTTPAPNDPESILAMANVYATLREIDSYTLHPDTFRSTLPVIGHTLPQTPPRRALDMILLTDDATAAGDQNPENPLAEVVTTWVASSLLPPEKSAPLPEPIAPGSDRYSGYSTFGVSKLALPTRAAMELAAVGLAQLALKAVKTAHASVPTGGWVGPIITLARAAMFSPDVLRTSSVAEKVREWSQELSGAGLIRKLEARVSRGESGRLFDLVQSEWRRLEREISADETHETAIPDSLRRRVDKALAAALHEVFENLNGCPVELAYAKGFGLVWAVSALDDLEQQLRAVLPRFQQDMNEAQAAYQISRQELFEIAQQHDTRSGGRFGSRSKIPVADLDARAGAGLTATVNLIVAQARLDTWMSLITLANTLRDQVRDVIPQVDQAAQALNAFETTCRAELEWAMHQPPRFPAGVIVSESWYIGGIHDTANMSRLPPRDLLRQMYTAWAPVDVPPDRQLSRFLQEIRIAARRALAGVYQFDDLYEFLAQHNGDPVFNQAVAGLPAAATPAMVPTVDDKHPAPTPFEIVREAPRALSALPQAQPGVTRASVPSPDPDEITLIRVLHGVMAEALPPLRESYRRAYDRAGAEGMPLHIDRRWDATMADLVHTSVRREVSIIWESILTAQQRSPHLIAQPLDALVRALGVALDVQETAALGTLPPDLRLVVYKLRPFRLKLPPPTCAVIFMYSHRPAQEIGDEIFRAVASLPLEEQFVFVVNINGRPDIEQVVEPLRRVDFTVMVLNEADIKHVISARLPTRALSDLVLAYVNLTTVSPFFTRGPVPEHMFFGREREINEVRSKLRTHSVALIGGRRIGKTSTLQRIQRLLKAPDSDYVPYYLDCHGATNYRSFFWLINRRWQVEMPPDAPPVTFEDVVTALQKRHAGKNIVILLDEVDSLLVFDRQPENQETLFRTLRSLSNEKRCQYVFSGEKWLLRAVANSHSALFNFVQAVRLEPLPPKVVHHLVADPFEMLNIWMEKSDQIIERIYQISAGHPNIVQMICQAMVEELDRDAHNSNLLTFEHLDRATSRRTLQEEIVQTIWGQMNPLARLITLLWPEGVRFLALADIEKLLHGIGLTDIPPERLERTAKDLELYCFVRPRDGDRLELIPMAFPAILDFMTDKQRQIEIVKRQYVVDPEGNNPT